MKHIRFLVLAVVGLIGLGAQRGAAQSPIAVQPLYFSFFNDYESDTFGTNTTVSNVESIIQTSLIGGNNVTQALYYQWGLVWTNLIGRILVREVNLSNGAEGLYIRGNGYQNDVSKYFTNELGASYEGDFTGQVTNIFAGITNFFTGLPIHSGFAQTHPGQPGVTNNLRQETIFTVSMDTTNMKFTFLGYGTAAPHAVVGRAKGVLYSKAVDSFYARGIGTMFHTAGTNIFYRGAVPPGTNFGPIYGVFWSGEPVFAALTNGPE